MSRVSGHFFCCNPKARVSVRLDMNNEIKVGSVVRLKSGGPAMTVDSITEANMLVCNWFNGGKCCACEFSNESLELVSSEFGEKTPLGGFMGYAPNWDHNGYEFKLDNVCATGYWMMENGKPVFYATPTPPKLQPEPSITLEELREKIDGILELCEPTKKEAWMAFRFVIFESVGLL